MAQQTWQQCADATVVYTPPDLRCQRRPVHLDVLQARARAVNRRLRAAHPHQGWQEGPGLTVRRPSGAKPTRGPIVSLPRRGISSTSDVEDLYGTTPLVR